MVTVQTFSSIFSQLLPEPHAGLLSGILFGTKASLSEALTDALVATGTLHIIALSGTNITLLTKIVNIVCLRVFPFVHRRVAAIISLIFITGFILFVGPTPSVVRAGIMGGISLVSVLTGRITMGIVSWLVAMLLMIVVNPSIITDLSFQLSALASLGIVLFGKTEERDMEIRDREMGERVRREKKIVGRFFGLVSDELHATLSAQVFTIPLIYLTFGRISLISPLTNLLIGWTIPAIMWLGFIIALTGICCFPLARIASWIAWLYLQYVIVVVEWTSRIPGASLGI